MLNYRTSLGYVAYFFTVGCVHISPILKKHRNDASDLLEGAL